MYFIVSRSARHILNLTTLLHSQEVAEPLMDLKESVQELHNNETFKHILATLLAIGNFLNGKKVCGDELVAVSW